jgi:hypothetical protein
VTQELVSDVANKINLIYRQCLNDDLSFPDGKSLYDVLEDTLRVLWLQNEDVRKERITKRFDGKFLSGLLWLRLLCYRYSMNIVICFDIMIVIDSLCFYKYSFRIRL